MGFKIISNVLLTRAQMDRTFREAERDQERHPELCIVPPPEPNGERGDMEYYVRLIRVNPYQYIVFTIDEVIRILKARGSFDGSHAALCNLLGHISVPYADDEDWSDDDDDGG